MKFKALFLSMTAATVFTGSAFAQKKSEPAADPAPPAPHDACDLIGLTPEQHAAIKDEHFKFEEKQIDLQATAEHARLAFRKVAADEKSDAKAIRTAAQKVADSVSQAITAEELFRADLIGKLIKPEQREAAMRCPLFSHPHGEEFGRHPHGPGCEEWHGHHGKEAGPRGKAHPEHEEAH